MLPTDFFTSAVELFLERDALGLLDLINDFSCGEQWPEWAAPYSDEVVPPDDLKRLDRFCSAIYEDAATHSYGERTRAASPIEWAKSKQIFTEFSEEGKQWLRTLLAELSIRQGENADRVFNAFSVAADEQLSLAIVKRMGQHLTPAFKRLKKLEKLELEGIGNEVLSTYFQQAHECYLFGFNIAVFATCRAILEMSLEEALQSHTPDLMPRAKAIVTPKKSLICAMLEVAERERLLTKETFEQMKLSPKELKDAANDAMHNPEKFVRDRQDDARAALVTTRAVVRELRLKRLQQA